MSFTVQKTDGKLIIKDKGGYETRNPATIWCVQQADAKYNWPDFSEITIHTGDSENSDADYTYSKQASFNRLVPDFHFHSWPEVGLTDYDSCMNDIHLAGLVPATDKRVGWIGNPRTNVRRTTLWQIGNAHPTLFNIMMMGWTGGSKGQQLTSTKYISTPDLVRTYAVLIDIEGNGYSGRLKHLLWSHRPVILVDRPHKEYFYPFLKKWVHYIPVKRDLSDLVEITQWALNNYEKACAIAQNAYDFCQKYLTRDACYKQWDAIIMDRPAVWS